MTAAVVPVPAVTAAVIPVGLCGRVNQADHQAERCDAKDNAVDVSGFAHDTPH